MLKCKVYSFETLDVWKEARKFAVKVYKLTKQLPSEEKFGLTSQMRRSCISISTNLAEGSSRESLKEQARFTEISFGSLLELLNHSILCFFDNRVGSWRLFYHQKQRTEVKAIQ